MYNKGIATQQGIEAIVPRTKQQAVMLLKKKPAEYFNSLQPKTVNDVFSSFSPSISEIGKIFGEAIVNANMVIWFNKFVSFFSTNGTMNDSQIAMTISLIREEYPHYKPDDLKLFFKMAMKGMFEKVYGRIDGEVIMRWLQEYDKIRDKAAQDNSINDSIKFKERFTEVFNFEGCIGFKEYKKIKERAKNGDKEAIKLLHKP